MRFTRRRSDRPDSARSRLGSSLEVLETRALMSRDVYGLFSQYAPNDLPIFNPITGQPSKYSVVHQLAYHHSPNAPLLSNEGKIISGKDRAGDEWTITVHGPGYAIVTDTTPNDGVLDDDIATIQLVGTDINKTYVTGNVDASFRVQTEGSILFNRLDAQSGVKSIILNGFSLGQTVTPVTGDPNNTTTGINLAGGVQYLRFHNILAPIDTSTADAPINVVIGDPSTPLKVEPTIHLDSIFTTVFDSTNTTQVQGSGPITDPSVNIVVNGQTRGISILSTSQDTVPAAFQWQFPVVNTTGRTAIQTIGIGHLNVRAGATNLTASRTAQPFQNGFSGLSKLGKTTFNGPTDAVGIDVNGPIKSIAFKKGLGNPNGVFIGQNAAGQAVPATQYGLPADQNGYAASGYVAGQVTATNIGHVNIGPATVRVQTAQNPDYGMLYRQGNTATFVSPGVAMVNSLIASSGSIGKTNIVGDQLNSEIKTGFHYPSFAAGLVGTRAASRLGKLHMVGDQTNGVNSASYRAYQHWYGGPIQAAGPGTITGNVAGVTNATGAITPLDNIGAGNFARTKIGYLPPPQAPVHHAAKAKS